MLTGAMTMSDAMPELCSTAVNEAKKWLEKKKLGSNSKSEVDLGPCNLNTDVLSDVSYTFCFILIHSGFR